MPQTSVTPIVSSCAAGTVTSRNGMIVAVARKVISTISTIFPTDIGYLLGPPSRVSRFGEAGSLAHLCLWRPAAIGPIGHPGLNRYERNPTQVTHHENAPIARMS